MLVDFGSIGEQTTGVRLEDVGDLGPDGEAYIIGTLEP